MKDWRLHRECDIGAIDAAAAFKRIGCESDLVVGDNVNRAAGRITIQLRQLQNFSDDTLTDKRSIAMNQNRHAPARASHPQGGPASVGPSPSTTGSTASR